jgi:hypothetical protein
MLTETLLIDRIEVLPESGVVQVRQVTRIVKDDAVIASSYRRWSLNPGQDVSAEDPKVQAVCQAVWKDA